MLKRLILAVVLFGFAGSADAGWYDVENFAGTVGSKHGHLSIQRYDSFGSGITVEGSYYVDDTKAPVPLYGRVVGSKLELCVISSEGEFEEVLVQGFKEPIDTASCPIRLEVSNDGAKGTWRDSANSLPVELNKVAALNDTGNAVIAGNVEIPFWAQTPDHMFLGVYEKSGSEICMAKLRVMNKATGRNDQEIPFETEPCDAGMVMTPIYMNVEQLGDETILINFRDGGMGYSKSYRFDQVANRFIEAR